MKRTLAALVAAPVLAACGASASPKAPPPTTPTTHNVQASVVLTDYAGRWADGDSCSGTAGYDDLTSGAQATIADENGKTIASTTLADGIASDASTCTFTFSFPTVPEAKFYGLTVAIRNKVTKSRADLAAQGWTFHLSLG
jgi:hypothetical protein